MIFKLRQKKIGAIPVLVIVGDITGANISKITAKLEGILKDSSEKIVIDLSETTFIDSHGLGVFVFFFRRLSDENRKLVFFRPSEFIRDLFSGSNLERIFTIVNDEESI